MPTPKQNPAPQQQSVSADDLVSVPGSDLVEPQQPGLLDRVRGWLDEKLAPRNTVSMSPTPLGQVNADLGDAIRGGVRNLIAPILHPQQAAEGMGTAIMASGMAPGGMYPIPQTPENQIHAQQELAPAAKSMVEHPADTIGGLVLPVLAGKAFGAVTGGVSDAAEAAGGYKPLIRGKVTDVLAPGTPAELLTRALKPGVEVPKPTEILERSLPDVIAAAENRPTSVEQYAAAADRARGLNQGAYRGLFQGENYKGEPIGSTPVSTTPLAKAIVDSVSPAHQFENPITGAVNALDEKAQFYGGNSTDLSTLDNVRETRNAELNNIFAASPADRASLVRANPDIAAKMAMRSAAADQTYRTLAEETGFPEDAIRANRNAYGDLRDTSDIAGKRATVYGRQNPVSLQEQFALNGPGRIRNFIFNRIFKEATGSDALVDAATRRWIAEQPDIMQGNQIGVSGPGHPFPNRLLTAGNPNDNIIDADTVNLPDSAFNNPMGWSANTTGAKVAAAGPFDPTTYKPPIGYPTQPTQTTPAPAPTLQLQAPSNDFTVPQTRGPIQLGPGPQPSAEVIGPGSSQLSVPANDLEPSNLVDVIKRKK